MESKKTAEYYIRTLNLTPHPGLETGYLSEVFRDPHLVTGTRGQQPRNAGTNIYFLHKPAPAFSANTIFFRMANSELLNFYTGCPLTLYFMPEPDNATMEKVVLGPNPGQHYFFALPRDRWFVRRLETTDTDAFTLIGCTVVPGYSDEDIETKTFGEIESACANK